MYRKEIKKHSRALKYPFKKGSFDNALVKTLLDENAIDEHEYINYALSLDTEIAKFCKENNYDASDFLSGKVFVEHEDKMVITLTAERYGEKTQILENKDIREASLLFTIIWTGYEITSKRDIEIFFLSEALRRIDEARAVRLLAHIYDKHKGFSEAVSSERRIADSNSLYSRIVSELPKGRAEVALLTTPRHEFILDYRGPEAQSIKGRMSALENELDYDQIDNFETSIVFLLRPFIRNSNVLSPVFRPKSRPNFYNGMWLNLSD